MCYVKNKKLCNNKKCEECKNASFASVDKSKYWSDKNKISPREITKGSTLKFWFVCKKGHEFQKAIKTIKKNSFCPYPCCCSSSKSLCDDKKCKICLKASFASSKYVGMWSKNNVKSPRKVFKHTTKIYLMICEKSEHEFRISLNGFEKNKNKCPFPCCSNTPTRLCNDDNCEDCRNFSFADHPMAKYFSKKNVDDNGSKIRPRDLFKNSHILYWFRCSESKHKFKARLDNISRDHDCPYPCCGKQKLCDSGDCDICYNASFASSERFRSLSSLGLKYFLANNPLPREIFKSTKDGYKFKCKNGHEFEASLHHINYYNSWCPRCPFPDESECIKILEKLTGEKFKKCRPEFLKDSKSKGLELDGYNEKLELAIEYNGEQHYKLSSLFHKNDEENLEKQKKRDVKKAKLCKENGVHLIIVPYYEKKNKDKIIEEEYEEYLLLKKI